MGLARFWNEQPGQGGKPGRDNGEGNQGNLVKRTTRTSRSEVGCTSEEDNAHDCSFAGATICVQSNGYFPRMDEAGSGATPSRRRLSDPAIGPELHRFHAGFSIAMRAGYMELTPMASVSS